jgi:hypothetical protein
MLAGSAAMPALAVNTPMGSAALASCSTIDEMNKHGEATRELIRESIDAWIDGFVSGFNLAHGGNVAEHYFEIELYDWVDQYCRAHPDDNIAGAAEQMVVQMKTGAPLMRGGHP